MRILVIGGTGFIGSCTVEALARAGHDVTVLHRGQHPLPPALQGLGIKEILGSREDLSGDSNASVQNHFDGVVDFILSSGAQAKALMAACRGRVGRVIAISSMDVYRAWGVFYGSEAGGLEPMPVNEDSTLRANPRLYPAEVLAKMHQTFGWVDTDYNKIEVEREIMSARVPATIVRLPMVYGPGDYSHRLFNYLKRMDDRRPFILLADDVATMQAPRGYVENVAAAIAIAATDDRAISQIYNASEQETFTELEWAQKIAADVGWAGEFIVLPHHLVPPYLCWPGNTAQRLIVDSSRIRQELGFAEPMDARQAMRRTIAWERAHPPEIGAAFAYSLEDEAVARYRPAHKGN